MARKIDRTALLRLEDGFGIWGWVKSRGVERRRRGNGVTRDLDKEEDEGAHFAMRKGGEGHPLRKLGGARR